MSIREELARRKLWLPKTLGSSQEGKLAPAAENIACEVYNSGDEDVFFRSFHPEKEKMHFLGCPPIHWSFLICKPMEFLFLPHSVYVVSTRSGRPPTLVTNYGDMIGKGNKLPSSPDIRKTQFVVKR